MNSQLPTGWRRLSRYGRFVAGLIAGRARRELIGGERAYASPAAVSFMEEMKGLPQKLGQHLAMKAPRYYDTCASLLGPGRHSPTDHLRRRLNEELGERAELLSEVDSRPVASVSLAQIYRGRLREEFGGEEVAVKLQHPGIREALEADLKGAGRMAGLIASLLPSLHRREREHVEALIEELRGDILRELNYDLEAERLRRFGGFLEERPGIGAPRLIEALSRGRVLTAEYVRGELLIEALRRAPRAQQKEALSRLAGAVLEAAFEMGLLHGDLHPGNLLASGPADAPLDRITLLDFGQVLDMPPHRWRALRELIEETRAGRAGRLGALLGELGAVPEEVDRLEPIALELSRVLLAPFIEPGRFDLDTWQMGARLKALSRESGIRWSIPAHFVWLQRSFHGLFFHVRAADARLNWYELLPDHC